MTLKLDQEEPSRFGGLKEMRHKSQGRTKSMRVPVLLKSCVVNLAKRDTGKCWTAGLRSERAEEKRGESRSSEGEQGDNPEHDVTKTSVCWIMRA